MRISLRLLVIRLLTLGALGVSAAIWVDHIRPTPAFCSLNSGCETVLYSNFGKVAGVPVPVLGLLAFGVLYVVSLYAKLRKRFLGPLCLASGVIGVGLIAFQIWYLQAICPLCVTVDSCAVAIALAYVLFGLIERRFRATSVIEASSQLSGGRQPPESPSAQEADAPRSEIVATGDRDQSSPWFWLILAVLVVVGTVIGGLAKPLPRVPPEIRAMWVAGKINIIEVTDFECPHCKRIHPVLKDVVAQYGDRVHFVRLVLPLPRHENAKGAARCYQCAEAQGKAEEMADELFGHGQLHPKGWEHMAEHVGLNMAEFRDCMVSSQREAALDKQIAWLQKTDLRALPAICIQDQVLMGTQPEDKIHKAISRAERALKAEEKK